MTFMPQVIHTTCLVCNGRCKNPAHYPVHVARSCRRKVDHKSLIDAIDTAIEVHARWGQKTHVYFCPLGDHFHISTRRVPSDLIPISKVLDDMGLGS